MDWSSISQILLSPSFGLTALGTALGGPAGGIIGSAAGKMVADALGVPATPEAVQAALSADPEMAKAQLAALERSQQAELAELQARFADTADARQMQVRLAETGSLISWGAPIVTAIVLMAFLGTMATVLLRGMPAGDQTMAIGLVELLKQLSVAVVFYWVGSSSGSKRNGDAVRAIASATPSLAEQAGVVLGRAVRK